MNDIRKYTANYSYTNPNFVIQNLNTKKKNEKLLPILYVAKNILQRGFPTVLSKYLQGILGAIHQMDNFEERILLVSDEPAIWYNTIKGDDKNNYYPAKDFFENIITKELKDYAFVQSLIIPEIEINDIVEQQDNKFIHQCVDFYLPQAKLVIEIDGQQHKLEQSINTSDKERDEFLSKNGVHTIRISTKALRDGSYKEKVQEILEHLNKYKNLLDFYRNAFIKVKENKFTDIEVQTKLLPSAIMRFQILIVELLIHEELNLESKWNFNILLHEDLDEFVQLAIDDLLIWLDKLYQLHYKKPLKKPEISIHIAKNKKAFSFKHEAINIDFSLFKRYTDENRKEGQVIYVRTDYFDILKDKNYFRVSTTKPINYNITDEDKATLEFFLENIFDKPQFREGQFPIVSNALNRKDTIGLLPTGGGKSLCYQLPCLLQPSINFVVCPIKSLMYDQYDNLVKTLITNVNFITSDLDATERRNIENNFEQGKYLFVWISPEKFQILSFRAKISSIVNSFSIAYAVIDEVHCLSEWGHDFRTSYLNLAKTVDKLSPKDENEEGEIKFIGLTATASVNVLKDIKIEFSRQKQRLADENIKSLLDYSRKELVFEVIDDNGDKNTELDNLLKKLKEKEGFLDRSDKAGIIFTPHVNGSYGCYALANRLNNLYANKVGWFSGDIPKIGSGMNAQRVMQPKEFNIYKQNVQKDFKENKYSLLVATKAFGMGIDKQNIHYTFHYGIPSSVEGLYQEAGRAGRWDKRKQENKDKRGKCYVLYSPEIYDRAVVQRLFHKDTSFAEMQTISEEVKWDGRDLFKQIFLFIQGQNDISKDFDIILAVIKTYFKVNSIVKIFWNDARKKIGINESILQKSIYRLSLLGIVEDWTSNFIDSYEVQFKTVDEVSILNSLSNYILKYEPNISIKEEVDKIPKNNILEKSIWYLLNWTFENISYSRKQSLKTVMDWCAEFDNSENFKKRIDSYFIFSERTFILQHIAENPQDYRKFFEVLAPNNKVLNVLELEKLKDSLSRFLESYRNNLALNFISGLVRLLLNEYEDSDGKERFESALGKIKNTLAPVEQDEILEWLKQIGMDFKEEQKMYLVQSICNIYPALLESLAEYFDLIYILNEAYAERLKLLKTINQKIYEQIGKI